jgi:hypothetical protein
MPVAIKGSGGGSVTLDAGAAAADSTLTLPNTTGTVIYSDSSGNVGIGTSSPGSYGKLEVAGSGYTGISARSTDASGVQVAFAANSSSEARLNVTTNNPLAIYTNNTERMRIDSSGTLLVGTTAIPGSAGVSGISLANNSSVGRLNIGKSTSGSQYAERFYYGATAVGDITYTDTATTFNSASDYRLKENVRPMQSALATVSKLKPVTYSWKINQEIGEGFIAHELQEFIPLAVTGEKDAVNEDGSINPQSVDYSKIVVHLVAALQELSAKNDALEARLAALEAK